MNEINYEEGAVAVKRSFVAADTSQADLEVAQHAGGWLRLSPQAQNQLIASYQQRKEIESLLQESRDRHDKQRLSRALSKSRSDAQTLVDSCFGLVWGKLSDAASSRMGEAWASSAAEDLKAEAAAFILDKALSYDPDLNSSFNAYLSGMVDPFVSDTLRSSGRTGSMSPAWERTLRMVSAIINEAKAAGSLITREEIKSKLEERFNQWARERMTEEEMLLPVADQQAAQRKKLSKQGMLGALKELDTLISLADGEVRLDETVRGDSDTTFGELYAGVTDVESSVFEDKDPEAALKRVYRVALGDKEGDLHALMVAYHGLLGEVEGDAAAPSEEDSSLNRTRAWSLARISSHVSMERVEVRNVLKDRARARLSAPHAQFAHLAFDVEIQFETEDADEFASIRSMPRDLFAE